LSFSLGLTGFELSFDLGLTGLGPVPSDFSLRLTFQNKLDGLFDIHGGRITCSPVSSALPVYRMTRPAAQPTYLFPLGTKFSADNLVLHARGRRHKVTDFAGPLSIKTVVTGAVGWNVGGRDFVVDPTSFLVLGDGEKYSMDLDAPQVMETACIFFQSGFVESIAQDATTPVKASLDDPHRTAPPLHYISRLHPDPERLIVQRVQTLARRCRNELQPSSFEEDFLLLSNSLLGLYRQIRSRIARVPALRSSTREELFRRIEVGREYIHGHADGPVSLEHVARAACLSRYHFHRIFTQVYEKTPHHYLTDIRLARAQSLLSKGLPVVEVCVDVGFNSPSSFSRLFRARYGVSPAAVHRARG
jgi:AraC family transcriptional regulator